MVTRNIDVLLVTLLIAQAGMASAMGVQSISISPQGTISLPTVIGAPLTDEAVSSLPMTLPTTGGNEPTTGHASLPTMGGNVPGHASLPTMGGNIHGHASSLPAVMSSMSGMSSMHSAMLAQQQPTPQSRRLLTGLHGNLGLVDIPVPSTKMAPVSRPLLQTAQRRAAIPDLPCHWGRYRFLLCSQSTMGRDLHASGKSFHARSLPPTTWQLVAIAAPTGRGALQDLRR